ncbi:HD domain-containing protein [Nocardia inohanensis]|uniref:HD domain-containing protein n=1 Tax=Nocardia inohanensis TaxID=209246 RepID=UPI001FE0E7E9|nr:HD domain-containing protein [Nocardia inohanensis]
MSVTADLRIWAADIARVQLVGLPRRWKHTQGVARQAERVSALVDDPDLLVASAWLHDVGYAEHLAHTGFHPLDGARFLAAIGAYERICGLVAHHSCACVEARNRNLMIDWADERTALRDALWWADMTTTPTGGITDVSSRIEEVLQRYGPDHVVARSVLESRSELLAAAERTEQMIFDQAQV